MNIIAEVQQVCALDMLKPGRQTELMLNRAHRLREAVSLAPAAGFWIVAAAFVAVMAIGALPTPLYVLYERRDHFSGLIVTVIFAAAAFGAVMAVGALPPPLSVLSERRDPFWGLIVTVIFPPSARGVVGSL